jgi:tetratricopeptide (TPR) repeat protein
MFEESSGEFEQALAIHRDDSIARVHLGLCLLFKGRWGEAIEMTQRAAGAREHWALYQTAHAWIRLGDRGAARRTIASAGPDVGRDELFNGARAVLAALEGNHQEARSAIESTIHYRKAYGHFHHAQYDVACAYTLMGDRETALDWLSDAAHNGFPCHPLFEQDPLLESLRSHERFGRLMEELRGECNGYRALWRNLRSAERC